jgi:hypothetical protein
MLADDDGRVVPLLPRDRASRPESVVGSGRARTPGDGPPPGDGTADDLAAEVARLRKRVRQQDLTLARLSDALVAMRRGGEALRAENRELRAQIEAGRLRRRRFA